MHSLAYDSIHDEIVVSSPLAQAVLTFRGGADGNEAPIRTIQGPRTQILGVNDKAAVDPVNNEILVPTWPGAILVFDREANGDVAPKRVLKGPDTQIRLQQPPGAEPGNQFEGYQETNGPAYVDPVRNLLIVKESDALLIFDRTASGNAKPKAVIKGPRTGIAGGSYNSFQISPKGWIIAGCSEGAVCAWSVDDNGDVPPRWKIPVQRITRGYIHSGIALDPVHKELILSALAPASANPPDGIRNAIVTFSWPEIF